MTIILAEDYPANHEEMVQILIDAGRTVQIVREDDVKAIKEALKAKDPIEGIIVDMNLGPGRGTGLSILLDVAKYNPELPTAIDSAYASEINRHLFLHAAFQVFDPWMLLPKGGKRVAREQAIIQLVDSIQAGIKPDASDMMKLFMPPSGSDKWSIVQAMLGRTGYAEIWNTLATSGLLHRKQIAKRANVSESTVDEFLQDVWEPISQVHEIALKATGSVSSSVDGAGTSGVFAPPLPKQGAARLSRLPAIAAFAAAHNLFFTAPRLDEVARLAARHRRRQ